MEKRKLNIKAPRYHKTKFNSLNDEFYQQLYANVPKSRTMEKSDIRSLIYAFNDKMVDLVINTRDGVEFPEQIGHCFICSCQSVSTKNINFRKYLDDNIKTVFTNWKTDGHVAKIMFSTSANRYRFKFNELYGFEGTRIFKRTLSKVYPDAWKNYTIVNKTKKITTVYNQETVLKLNKKTHDRLITTYNEFEL